MGSYLVDIKIVGSKTIPVEAESKYELDKIVKEIEDPEFYEFHDMDVESWKVVEVRKGDE